MRKYQTREARVRLGEVLKACREEPVAIMRHRRVAAIVIAPWAFDEYRRFRDIINNERIVSGVERAVELMRCGESARAVGAFRALSPYWREAGIKSAPRLKKSPGRS